MTREQLRILTAHYRSNTAFICGPEGLLEAARAALRDNEMPADRINVEVFKSLDTDPFTAVARTAGRADERTAVQVEIDLQGKTYRLLWPADVTLLDLMLSHGLDAPHLCREGVCGTCTCLLERGKVRMLSDEAVNPEDIAAGYVLACQSLHTGVDAKITF
jgi:3-ketosteroid 9alpha-monooxygenase subunit B